MALVPYNLNIAQGSLDLRNPSASSSALIPASPDLSLHLLNSMLIFYEQRKQWVQRSRSSLELAFVQGSLCLQPRIGDGTDTDSQSDSSGSAPSVCSSEATNEPTPQTSDADSCSYDSDGFIKQEDNDDDDSGGGGGALSTTSRALIPLTLRATTKAQAPSSRWLKRKQSFKLHLGPLNQRAPTRPRRQLPNDGPEPSVQLLELFGDLLDARMESCLRITRLVRNANRAMLRQY